MIDINQNIKFYISLWVKEIQHTVSKHTLRAYTQDINQFFLFLSTHFAHDLTLQDLNEISIQTIRSWLSKRKNDYEVRSTIRAFSAIKKFFHFLQLKKYIKNSPFDNISPPRIKKLLPKPLSIEQAFDLIENINENEKELWVGIRNQAFFMLIYSVGLRISEALSLNQKMIKNDDDFFTILGKGSKERSVPLLENVKMKILSYLEKCPYPRSNEAPLFYGTKGKRLSAGVMQRVIKNYRQLNGLPIHTTPHAFRHSCATHLIDQSDDLRSVQELLGHKSLSTTQIYTKVSQQKMLKTYEIAHPRARK